MEDINMTTIKNCTACEYRGTTMGKHLEHTETQPVLVAQSLNFCGNNPQGNGVHMWDIDMTTNTNSSWKCKMCGLRA